MTDPTPEDIREFAGTLPNAYRDQYDADAVRAHARVALSRGELPAKIGPFESGAAYGHPICVVADDRPGLLALVSEAFVMAGLDVVDADAYTRKNDRGMDEAVDLFWLRPLNPESTVDPESVRQAEKILVGLLGTSSAPGPAESGAQRISKSPASVGTTVRFLEQDGVLSVLEVETDDRSGLLHAITHALFEERVQIVRSEVKTMGGRVRDRFHVVELDGAPIREDRRLALQVAIITAVDAETTPQSATADVS